MRLRVFIVGILSVSLFSVSAKTVKKIWKSEKEIIREQMVLFDSTVTSSKTIGQLVAKMRGHISIKLQSILDKQIKGYEDKKIKIESLRNSKYLITAENKSVMFQYFPNEPYKISINNKSYRIDPQNPEKTMQGILNLMPKYKSSKSFFEYLFPKAYAVAPVVIGVGAGTLVGTIQGIYSSAQLSAAMCKSIGFSITTRLELCERSFHQSRSKKIENYDEYFDRIIKETHGVKGDAAKYSRRYYTELAKAEPGSIGPGSFAIRDERVHKTMAYKAFRSYYNLDSRGQVEKFCSNSVFTDGNDKVRELNSAAVKCFQRMAKADKNISKHVGPEALLYINDDTGLISADEARKIRTGAR